MPAVGQLWPSIFKKMEIWSDVTIAGRQTIEQGKIELLSHGLWKAEISNWVIRVLLFKIAIEILPKKIFNEKC